MTDPSPWTTDATVDEAVELLRRLQADIKEATPTHLSDPEEEAAQQRAQKCAMKTVMKFSKPLPRNRQVIELAYLMASIVRISTFMACSASPDDHQAILELYEMLLIGELEIGHQRCHEAIDDFAKGRPIA